MTLETTQSQPFPKTLCNCHFEVPWHCPTSPRSLNNTALDLIATLLCIRFNIFLIHRMPWYNELRAQCDGTELGFQISRCCSQTSSIVGRNRLLWSSTSSSALLIPTDSCFYSGSGDNPTSGPNDNISTCHSGLFPLRYLLNRDVASGNQELTWTSFSSPLIAALTKSWKTTIVNLIHKSMDSSLHFLDWLLVKSLQTWSISIS